MYFDLLLIIFDKCVIGSCFVVTIRLTKSILTITNILKWLLNVDSKDRTNKKHPNNKLHTCAPFLHTFLNLMLHLTSSNVAYLLTF